MSLYDKKNALQYGGGYNSAQWKSVSATYADEPDADQKEELQQVIDENVSAHKQRAEQEGADIVDVKIDVHQVAPQEVQSLRQRAESSTRHAVPPQDQQIITGDAQQASDEPAPVASTTQKQQTTQKTSHKVSLRVNNTKHTVKSTVPTAQKTTHITAPQGTAVRKAQTSAKTKGATRAMTTHVQLDRSKHTILIVDDDYDTRTMYATIFQDAGFNVLEAEDGLEGLDIATKHQPDVIFTGIIMPRMDGFTMVEAIKKNSVISDVPIVINSHLGRAQDKVRAKELGIRDFIVRDYTAPREVLDRITALLVTMEYKIPLDMSASYAKELLADLGGKDAIGCNHPILKLRLTDAMEKTFSAQLACEEK